MSSRAKRLFGDEPRTLQEKKVIYLDPRLKSMDLYEQRNLEGEVACWREARNAVKKDIVSAIEFDRALEAEQLANEPVAERAARPAAAAAADGAAAAAATGADDGSDSDDGGDSFASALARKRPPASAPAPPPREDERLLPDEMAEIELREYDALEELPRVLLPNRETGEVPLCVTHHWTDLKFCHVIGRIS